MEAVLAGELTGRLSELGLHISQPDALNQLAENEALRTMLGHREKSAAYQLVYLRSLTLSGLSKANLPASTVDRPLLLGPRVTERSAEAFRGLGFNYLDGAGNAYITFGGVHIDVRGRRSKRAPHTRPPGTVGSRGGVNLFSTKRAQVIFAILSWPPLLEGPLRELAVSAGVSLGLAKEVLDLLAQFEHLNEKKQFNPQSRDALIEQWAASYPTGLGSPTSAHAFSGDPSRIPITDVPLYISGEAAVPEHLRPETMLLYTDEFPSDLVLAGRWRRDTDSPNIFLRRKFWTSPHGADDPGIHAAPWLLVYADLLASNDSRQREAAQQLRMGQQ